jgi:hypothetical protein
MKAIINIKFIKVNGIDADKFNENDQIKESANKLIGILNKELKKYFKKHRIDVEVEGAVINGSESR